MDEGKFKGFDILHLFQFLLQLGVLVLWNKKFREIDEKNILEGHFQCFLLQSWDYIEWKVVEKIDVSSTSET